MPRFSLTRLFVLVALVGLTLAAVVSPSGWWLAGISTTIVVLLSYGTAYIAIGGEHRAYWIGVVLFVLVNGSLMQLPLGWVTHPSMMLPELLVRSSLGPPPRAPSRPPQGGPSPPNQSQQVQQQQWMQHFDQYNLLLQQYNQKREDFRSMVIGLTLVWIAAIGGWVGQWIAYRRSASRPTAA